MLVFEPMRRANDRRVGLILFIGCTSLRNRLFATALIGSMAWLRFIPMALDKAIVEKPCKFLAYEGAIRVKQDNRMIPA
jgi:hypothetical protein